MTHSFRGKLAYIAFAGILICGCSGNLPDVPTDTATTSPASGDFQAKALEDGVVTEAEYEEAVIAFLTCVEDAGFAAHGPVWDERNRRFAFTVTVGIDNDTGLAESEMDRCGLEYLDQIVSVWDEQVRPTPNEYARQFDAFKECLISEGIEGIESITDSVILMQTLEELGGKAYLELCRDINPDAYIIDVGPLPEFNGPGAG